MVTQPNEGYELSRSFKIHFVEWGSKGERILILHSMMMDAHSFDIFSSSMVKDYHLLGLDLLGHGDSDKPEETISLEEHVEILRGVAMKKGFADFALVGHSIGGILGIAWAAKYPEEITRLVLVDIAPRDPAAPFVRTTIPVPESFRTLEEARSYLRQRYPKFTEEALENRMRYGVEKVREGQYRLKVSPQTREMLWKSNIDLDLWPYLSRVRAPVLLIKGKDSQTVSPASIELMNKMLVSFELIEIENATHMVPQDAPEQFEEAVRSFIRKQ
jgi:pimeloyl-ACP methyl ester carboxylesterase